MSNIKRIWEKASGLNDNQSLESHTFRSISILTLIILVVLVLSNLAMGMEVQALITSIGIVTLIGVFYLGYFDRTFNLAIALFTIFTYLIVFISFLYNSGIDGPIMYFQLVTFLLLIAVAPKRSHVLLFVMHGILSIGLLFISYQYPEQIFEVYHSKTDRYIDHSLSLIVALTIVFVLIKNIRSHYAKQSILAQQTAKELEEQQGMIKEQNIALENVNKTQSRMISILSHDIRSPLNSIAGYLDLLKTGLLTQEEQMQTSTQLLDLTKQTDNMLVNLLSWSRSQIQGFHPKLEVLPVSDIISEIIPPIESAAHQKKLTLEVNLESSRLTTDKEMLQLIIRNLLNNAIKYTHEGGKVAIHSWTDSIYYYIEVKDTGTGIPKEMHGQLFSEATISKAGTKNEKGTGLGLLLVHDFVEKLDGEITFDSVEGSGTSFLIKFPYGSIAD